MTLGGGDSYMNKKQTLRLVLRHCETGKPVRMAFVSSDGDIIGNFGELSADIKRRQEMDAGFYL